MHLIIEFYYTPKEFCLSYDYYKKNFFIPDKIYIPHGRLNYYKIIKSDDDLIEKHNYNMYAENDFYKNALVYM